MYKKITALSCDKEKSALINSLLLMKLALIILLISFFEVNATTYAQLLSINKKEASLNTVFKEIQQQSGYRIFYDAQMVKEALPVTLYLHQATLREAMDQSLRHQGL